MNARERLREIADGTRTARELAEATGISRTRVNEIAREERLAIAAASPQTDAWPPEKVAELTRLWGEGLSITQIGLALGISRSAAVSKVHRIGLPQRGSPIPKKAVSRREPVPVPVATPDPDLSTDDTRSTPRALIDRPGLEGVHLSRLGEGCRFPLWSSNSDPLWMRYCGAAVPEGRSYCPHHDYRMHWNPTPAERAAAEAEEDAEADDVADGAPPPEDEDGEAAEVAA